MHLSDLLDHFEAHCIELCRRGDRLMVRGQSQVLERLSAAITEHRRELLIIAGHRGPSVLGCKR